MLLNIPKLLSNLATLPSITSTLIWTDSSTQVLTPKVKISNNQKTSNNSVPTSSNISINLSILWDREKPYFSLSMALRPEQKWTSKDQGGSELHWRGNNLYKGRQNSLKNTKIWAHGHLRLNNMQRKRVLIPIWSLREPNFSPKSATDWDSIFNKDFKPTAFGKIC